jgi:uncharacterized protein YjaG (DUF416 family)
MEYHTRLLYKDKMHPEIYNSNISMDEKLFLQNQLEKFEGDFDKLLEDMEKYAVLPDVEDYENAAKIRDYRIQIKAPLSN